MAGHKSFIIQV